MTLAVNVLTNIREFLQRVDVKGLESFAFVEAYSAIQNEIALANNPQLAAAIAAGARPVQALPTPVEQPATETSTTVEQASSEDDVVPGPLDPQE